MWDAFIRPGGRYVNLSFFWSVHLHYEISFCVMSDSCPLGRKALKIISISCFTLWNRILFSTLIYASCMQPYTRPLGSTTTSIRRDMGIVPGETQITLKTWISKLVALGSKRIVCFGPLKLKMEPGELIQLL